MPRGRDGGCVFAIAAPNKTSGMMNAEAQRRKEMRAREFGHFRIPLRLCVSAFIPFCQEALSCERDGRGVCGKLHSARTNTETDAREEHRHPGQQGTDLST